MSKSIVVCTIVEMRGKAKKHPGGSIFLGYFDIDLTFLGVTVRIPNFEFRKTVAGVFAVEFPCEKYTDRDGEEKKRSVIRPTDGISRKVLTLALRRAFVDWIKTRKLERELAAARAAA